MFLKSFHGTDCKGNQRREWKRAGSNLKPSIADEGTKRTSYICSSHHQETKAASQQIPHDQAYPDRRREDYKPPDRQEAKPPSEGKKKLKILSRLRRIDRKKAENKYPILWRFSGTPVEYPLK